LPALTGRPTPTLLSLVAGAGIIGPAASSSVTRTLSISQPRNPLNSWSTVRKQKPRLTVFPLNASRLKYTGRQTGLRLNPPEVNGIALRLLSGGSSNGLRRVSDLVIPAPTSVTVTSMMSNPDALGFTLSISNHASKYSVTRDAPIGTVKFGLLSRPSCGSVP